MPELFFTHVRRIGTNSSLPEKKVTGATNTYQLFTCLNMPKILHICEESVSILHTCEELVPCLDVLWNMRVYTIVCLTWFFTTHQDNLSGIKRRIYLGWTSTKPGLMCFAQRLNAVTPVRFEPAAPRSRVKHSTVAYTIVSIYAVPFDGAHGIGVQTRYKSI